MPFATDILKDPSVSASARQQALNRIFSDPGVPQNSTTSSFWTQEQHDFSQGTAKSLPKEADIVIIGSGITGASIARTLLQSRASNSSTTSHPSIVMLEARTVCSGATGRNGGHILETADEYSEFADIFGVDAARKLVRFRLAHLQEMLAVAEELGITTETQARKVQFLSVYFSEETWQAALERMHRFKEKMPEEAAEWTSYEGDAIPKEMCLTRARGIVAGPAGALWPYKFVAGVLKRLLTDFPDDFQIEENTPVTAIHDETSSTGPRYKVETSRGTIITRHVIHCTNAHVSHLVPGLRGRIFPVRGQMSAQTPGDKFPNQASHHSWVFNYDRGFDYLTQLPEGQMMLGGGFAQGETGGLQDLGISTDCDLSLYIDIHLSGALRAIFGGKDWGCVQGDAVQAMWTGNMAFSSDGFPWVGQLPGAATGRSEHGSEGGSGGKAMATMLLMQDASLSETVSGDISWFPEQLLVSEGRFADAVLPKVIVDDVYRASL
ncbi:FAD dependent oxidoreductase [Penicillium cf. griseofulvum]|uniref:FAD dependent oxidoreductase n=1 Tax=Penicillium cf. griseofulvum TaxID=2972120 RepID=A0A9W9MSX1_9EURO|nr:FAD dependent oxidoreductase [Penicillium cf. griseofulvum]